MRQPKSGFYVQVQRHKTLKYGERQHYQDYITIPADLSETLGLRPGQVMKCVLSGSGNSLTYIEVTEKPSSGRMKYEEWRDIIRHVAPAAGGWKTYDQISGEGNISMKTAPAYWVKLAENDIGLIRKRDTRTNRIQWDLPKETSL
jgi:bifunctional DNA-binding transcriptional regulator/antitoxin component of YhaV-PrlF toxin-antitoxin module